MNERFDGLAFSPADILLPQNCELKKWAVVACDQYTSQPEYWERVEAFVGQAPSALRLVLPEGCLDGPDVENDITEINTTMTRYLRAGQFRELPNALIFVERTLADGSIRRGLVGKVDLEQYDYEQDSTSLIRATEGTVLSRIPPRVAVRKNAPIELPHAMLLCDDPLKTVLEPLAEEKETMGKLYEFDLMEESGHVAGWLLTEKHQEQVAAALGTLKHDGADGMLFAVGDGNHSLATAKECYERQKRLTPENAWATLPARWTLVELCNLHDTGIQFQPIHRTVFDVDTEHLIMWLSAKHEMDHSTSFYPLQCFSDKGNSTIYLPCQKGRLPVDALQERLDQYVARFGGRVDYIHGADVAVKLAIYPRRVTLLMPALEKQQLFPAIVKNGSLPRKTFSVGEAKDKRFYLEARKIR